MVIPSAILEQTVVAPTHFIASGIKTSGTERVGDEAVVLHGTMADITGRNTRATYIQVPHYARWQRTTLRIEYPGTGVINRTTYRQLAMTVAENAITQAACRCDDRGLGGPIGVPQSDLLRDQLMPACQGTAFSRFTTNDDVAQARWYGRCPGLIGEQTVPECSWQVENADTLRCHTTPESLGARAHLIISKYQCGTIEQSEIDLFDAGVEAQRRKLQHPVLSIDLKLTTERSDVVNDAGLGNLDAFRTPGRARGINQVHQRIEISRCRHIATCICRITDIQVAQGMVCR